MDVLFAIVACVLLYGMTLSSGHVPLRLVARVPNPARRAFKVDD